MTRDATAMNDEQIGMCIKSSETHMVARPLSYSATARDKLLQLQIAGQIEWKWNVDPNTILIL